MNKEFRSPSPIKTEYKGVCYRSKSEAILARAIDLSKCWREAYYVESIPGLLRLTPHYTPDFVVCTSSDERFLIEYKPSTPTDTYVSNMEDIINDSIDTLTLYGINAFILLVGSYYTHEIPWRYNILWKGKRDFDPFLELKLRLLTKKVSEAAIYRFDLKHNISERNLVSETS